MRNIILFLFLFSKLIQGQNTIPEVLKKYNTESVPYISVQDAAQKTSAIFLDTRETNEFNVSHIDQAIHVGFHKFNVKTVSKKLTNKDAIIIVYCSIGVRSEKIGEKLIKMGYKNVYNMYGGIFEWKNMGYKVFDSSEKETENVHVYGKEWEKHLNKGNKIY